MKANGTLSFRMFYVPRPWPHDAIRRFADHAMPPIDTLGDGTIHGWVTGRHALDRNINDDTAIFGGYPLLQLVQAERKVPPALLAAEIRIEELAQMAARGDDRLASSVRRDIRKQVLDRLQTHAQPTLKGIPFVYDPRNELIYAAAMSDAQVDTFQIHFAQTIGFSLIPVTPDMVAIKRAQCNVRDLDPCTFSPECDYTEVAPGAGLDFLMWLWFVAEARGGRLQISDVGDIDVMIEGPLVFVGKGGGAHQIGLKNGQPMLASETKAALLAGKKLRRAKVTLAHGEDIYSFTLDAIPFAFRSLKLPDGEKKLDPISRFQDRMDKLDFFQRAFLGFYDRFLAERRDHKRWSATIAEIHTWATSRRAR